MSACCQAQIAKWTARVDTADGGVFVILAILWGWLIDGKAPDRFDLVGAVFCLAGVTLIMWWPRGL